MDHTWTFLGSGILIHTLELKISHFKCFPICLYREAMRLQCFPPTRYVRGGDTRAHKRDDLYPISSKLKYRLPACIVWLYYACFQLDYMEVSGHFFFLLSVVPLKIKHQVEKKKTSCAKKDWGNWEHLGR